jgi:hypothetical protein
MDVNSSHLKGEGLSLEFEFLGGKDDLLHFIVVVYERIKVQD